MKSGYNKEPVYDERIAPLVHEIFKICKAEEIPLIMDFYLKSPDMTPVDEGDMHCISYIKPEGNTPNHFPDVISRLYNRGEKPWAMAVTVTSGGGERE